MTFLCCTPLCKFRRKKCNVKGHARRKRTRPPNHNKKKKREKLLVGEHHVQHKSTQRIPPRWRSVKGVRLESSRPGFFFNDRQPCRSVRLMPQNQPSGRGLLPSLTAWSPDQHPAAMLADVFRHILGRTEGRGLGFGQLVRTHTGKCLKCQSSSDGHSDRSSCVQAEDGDLLGPLQPPNWAKVCLVSTAFFLPVPVVPKVEKCLGLSVGDRVLCLRPGFDYRFRRGFFFRVIPET